MVQVSDMIGSLSDTLKQKRSELATLQGVPAYMIFSNAVIDELVIKRPQTIAELQDIKGLGEKKIQQFGYLLIDMVNEAPLPHATIRNRDTAYSVSEYIGTLNAALSDYKATVQGEITDVSKRDRYVFFTLKDTQLDASLSCFMWMNDVVASGVTLEIGSEVVVVGHPAIYSKRGSLSFNVQYVSLIGEGAIRAAYEALLQKLQAEGLFSDERKKPIPAFSKHIGLITSTFADAKKDFLTHLGHNGFSIYFQNVHVEGLYAVEEIVAAIRNLNESSLPLDVIVLTRGGGSLESLQAFNAEPVARAIRASRIPVLVAVGHENDITIADMVSDLRASTPTDAGKILSDPWKGIAQALPEYEHQLIHHFHMLLTSIKEQLYQYDADMISDFEQLLFQKKVAVKEEGLRIIHVFETLVNDMKHVTTQYDHSIRTYETALNTKKEMVLLTNSSLNQLSSQWIRRIKTSLTQEEQLLAAHDPKQRLKQGYSFVTRDGTIVRNAEDLSLGDTVSVQFFKGSALTKVEKTWK